MPVSEVFQTSFHSDDEGVATLVDLPSACFRPVSDLLPFHSDCEGAANLMACYVKLHMGACFKPVSDPFPLRL